MTETLRKKIGIVGAVVIACCLSVALLSGCSSDQQKSNSEQEEQISVMLTIDTSAVDDPIVYSEKLTLSAGSTVADALTATGLSVNSTTGAYGTYISAIGGLAEKDHGDMSGWTFTVNDEMAMETAETFVVNNEDRITWEYVTTFE